MIPGEEECYETEMQSTVMKPDEHCDLQPTPHCRKVSSIVPHLVPKTKCEEIPAEVCHTHLGEPKKVNKLVTLRYVSTQCNNLMKNSAVNC